MEDCEKRDVHLVEENSASTFMRWSSFYDMDHNICENKLKSGTVNFEELYGV